MSVEPRVGSAARTLQVVVCGPGIGDPPFTGPGESAETTLVMRAGADRVVQRMFAADEVRPGAGVAVRAVGIGGGSYGSAAVRLLLRTSDAIVFLPDGADPSGASTRTAFRALRAATAAADCDPSETAIYVAESKSGAARSDAEGARRLDVASPVFSEAAKRAASEVLGDGGAVARILMRAAGADGAAGPPEQARGGAGRLLRVAAAAALGGLAGAGVVALLL